MPYREALRLAIATIRGAKLRAFFTLLGIIVSVGFLVTVVAVIQGMNFYVKDNLTASMIGTNAFQVRRGPISIGLLDDSVLRRVAMRPKISVEDAQAVAAAIPDAEAVAIQSGWPTPVEKVQYRNKDLNGVLVFGVTPPYQSVQDYSFVAGQPLAEPDMRGQRYVTVVGHDIADKLFASAETAVGSQIRIGGAMYTIKGVIAAKGTQLGQSFDSFVLLPLPAFESQYGRRQTTVVSVKMRTAEEIDGAMQRAEEAMRIAHQLRPKQEDDFTVDKADALIAFWKSLTSLLFAVIPAVVGIGIVVGGIVIMNIMLMSVSERTREIGIRKAVGANERDIRRQFLVETVILSALGGIIGVAAGWALAQAVRAWTPLPATVTMWSVGVALALGAGTGIIFGVYPAARAAKLDPIDALRKE
jgi:putative ABC transport system permease protein